jgi:hypothetical protein
MFPPDCSLTTACFSLSRTPDDECVNLMKPLLQIPCYLVIFTDFYCVDKIKTIRTSFQLENLTYCIVIALEQLYFYKNYMGLFSERYLIKISKFHLVLETIRHNPFYTTKFGWIDYNTCGETCDNHLLLHALHHSPPNKFNIQILNVCDKKYKRAEHKKDYYSQSRPPIVRGSLFITDKNVGIPILNRLHAIAATATADGYGRDGEEACYLEVLDEFYDDIEKSYGEGPVQLIIIQRYLHFYYYKECYDCCKKILGEIEDFSVPIDYDLYFKILFFHYICSFYYKRDESKFIYKKIMRMVEINPYVKREYLKNKDYYDSQFRLNY